MRNTWHCLWLAPGGPFSPFGFAHVYLKKVSTFYLQWCLLVDSEVEGLVCVRNYIFGCSLGTKVTSSMLLVSMFNPLETI